MSALLLVPIPRTCGVIVELSTPARIHGPPFPNRANATDRSCHSPSVGSIIATSLDRHLTSNFGVGCRKPRRVGFLRTLRGSHGQQGRHGGRGRRSTRIWVHGAQRARLPDASVALVVTHRRTSPARLEDLTDDAIRRLRRYLEMLKEVFASASYSGPVTHRINILTRRNPTAPLRRRHPHPPGPPRAAAPGRDHLAEGARRGRQLRVGQLQERQEPGGPRPHRAGDRGQQGPVRSGSPHRAACGRRPPPCQHHRRRPLHGPHAGPLGVRPGVRHPGRSPQAPFRSSCRSASSSYVPRDPCSTPSWGQGPPVWLQQTGRHFVGFAPTPPTRPRPPASRGGGAAGLGRRTGCPPPPRSSTPCKRRSPARRSTSSAPSTAPKPVPSRTSCSSTAASAITSSRTEAPERRRGQLHTTTNRGED